MEQYEDVYVKEGDNYRFIGDFLISSAITENSITFRYVLGGHYLRDEKGEFVAASGLIDETGIIYEETYPYKKNQELKTVIEGKEVTLYYDEIDYDSKKIEVYNNDYNLSRSAIQSKIIKMNVGDTWNNEDAIETPVFKNDILMGITDNPKYNVNIEIDRGGVSIKEKHFKLGECNTFEDLENYGNDYFGLNN